jgi:2,3-bisphosphoglycerate-independent phosphoglycerate mutase
LDKQVGTLAEETLKRGGNIILTADHGNAESMFDEKENQPNTFHTKNPAPFLLAGDRFKKMKLDSDGVLGNIAPTILEILNIEKPSAMKCRSLI